MGVRLGRREKTYLLLRLGAVVLFLVGAFALPHGPLAGVFVILAGVIAVGACFGVTAGGPGERAGAARQDRYYERLRAPQGDWPPYDPDLVVDGEVVKRAPE